MDSFSYYNSSRILSMYLIYDSMHFIFQLVCISIQYIFKIHISTIFLREFINILPFTLTERDAIKYILLNQLQDTGNILRNILINILIHFNSLCNQHFICLNIIYTVNIVERMKIL